MASKQARPFCKPQNAGLASATPAVEKRLGRLLTAMDTEINANIVNGTIVQWLHEKRFELVGLLEKEGNYVLDSLDKPEGVNYIQVMTQRQQGSVIIEPDDERGYLVMTPDGDVIWKPTKAAAERHARVWFKAHLNGADVGIGSIEWR